MEQLLQLREQLPCAISLAQDRGRGGINHAMCPEQARSTQFHPGRVHSLGLLLTRQAHPFPCPSSIFFPSRLATSFLTDASTISPNPPTPYFAPHDPQPTSSRAVLVHPERASSSGVSGGKEGVNVEGLNVRRRERSGRGEKGAYVVGGGNVGRGAVEGMRDGIADERGV
jgi:hypothetical protein